MYEQAYLKGAGPSWLREKAGDVGVKVEVMDDSGHCCEEQGKLDHLCRERNEREHSQNPDKNELHVHHIHVKPRLCVVMENSINIILYFFIDRRYFDNYFARNQSKRTII